MGTVIAEIGTDAFYHVDPNCGYIFEASVAGEVDLKDTPLLYATDCEYENMKHQCSACSADSIAQHVPVQVKMPFR